MDAGHYWGLEGQWLSILITCLLDNLWILKGEILSKWNKLSWGRSFDLNADYMKLFSMMKIPTGAAKILIKFNFDLLLLPLYFSNFFYLNFRSTKWKHFTGTLPALYWSCRVQISYTDPSWRRILTLDFKDIGTRWFFFYIHSVLSFGEQLAWGFSPKGMWKCRPVSHTANLIA